MISILYVDDDADIREIADIALSLDPDLDVRLCASGEDAVALAATWRPALIMLDFMMPGMDGPATLHALRAQAETRNIPIVFITARSSDRDIATLLALGAEGVLAKPFDPMTLAAEARQFL
ncbi:response regulator [Sphingobium terrigena]|uniref:Response regulator n=1 Tax=Sphingobium terrigena TaxID=2304063 RepID=A0A418YM11_9SPHN|nr:response regulator [Sphingobium terrigena]RJG52152.1 response regulator [Sphingobium terrigena]